MLKRHLESIQQALAQLDDRVDAGKTAQDFFTVLNAATPLQRTTRNLHKALQDAREGIEDRDIIALRDSAGDLEHELDSEGRWRPYYPQDRDVPEESSDEAEEETEEDADTGGFP